MEFFRKPTPSEQLRWGCLFFVIGLFFPAKAVFLEAFLVSGILFAASCIFKKFQIVPLAVLCFASAWSGWRNVFDFRNDVLFAHQGQVLQIEGIVRTSPDVREDSVRAFVTSSKGDFLLILPYTETIQYGDTVFLQGKVTVPRTLQDFDYLRYLRRWGAQTIIKNPSIFEIRASAQGNALVHRAQDFRMFLEKNVRKSLPEPHATIAVGVLLGVKSALPEWTGNDFKNSGLQHLLVVSGSNVAIVLALVAMLLAPLGRRAVCIGSLLALCFFVLLVGPDAPVIRAAVMGGMVGIAVALGRFSDARTLVLVSACVIGFFQPAIVRDDVGFHLSFAATIGIIIGTPLLMHFFSRYSKHKYWKWVSLVFAVSLSAQIAVLPILGSSFGVFPVAGVLANIFAEPLVPLAMGMGTITAFLGWVPLFIARFLAIPAFIVIEGLLLVAYIFGQIPPLSIAPWGVWSAGIIIGGVMVWGLFSRSFSERWLVRDA